ncbi:hypothetical protein AVEN_31741-1, partial [Araneus ventricosus]
GAKGHVHEPTLTSRNRDSKDPSRKSPGGSTQRCVRDAPLLFHTSAAETGKTLLLCWATPSG